MGDRKRKAVYGGLTVWAEELQVIKESTFPQARHAQVTARKMYVTVCACGLAVVKISGPVAIGVLRMYE